MCQLRRLYDANINVISNTDYSYMIIYADMMEELKGKLEHTMSKHINWLCKLGMVVNSK